MIESKNTLVGKINSKQESLHCNLNVAIEYIPPSTQEKTVLPTNTIQEITPDKDYTGLSKVTINAIPTEETTVNLDFGSNETINIKPSANKFLTNVSIEKDVNLEPSNIKKDVEIFGVTGTLAGEDINEYFETTITSNNRGGFGAGRMIKKLPVFYIEGTSLANIFSNYSGAIAPLFQNEDKVTDWSYAFTNSSITEFPQYNTSNGKFFSYAFCCGNLKKMPLLDLSNAQSIGTILHTSNANLTYLGGFKNLGKAYLKTSSANYSPYKLDISGSRNLPHDSLMNVFNNLYDIASKGVQPQQIVLGNINLAKLTAEEIAIATNKGWNVS